MIAERVDLEEALVEVVNTKVKPKRKMVKELKEKMKEFGIDNGETSRILNNIEENIKDVDSKLLVVLSEQIYILTGDMRVSPAEFFTEIEIKHAKLYAQSSEVKEKLSFPIVLPNTNQINNEDYSTIITGKMVKELIDSQLLHYDFSTQREAERKQVGDQIIRVAKTNKKAVNEIKKLFLNKRLESTTITFNALVGSADRGDELTYNPNKRELTINPGTILNFVDGFHRISGVIAALEINPSLDITFTLAIKNFDTRRAQQHLAQISKINPIAESHIQALEAPSYADDIVKYLDMFSDLKERITTETNIKFSVNELVTYSTLADTIDKYFKIDSKKESNDIGKYLSEFFDYLIGSYPDEFIHNVKETNSKSIINSSSMFAGYIVLAKRMKENNIPLEKLEDIINSIDFSRTNKMWKDLDVLTEDGNLKKAKKGITTYFENIDLDV